MKLTVYKASIELGVSRETLERGLMANGIQVVPKATYNLRELVAALTDEGKVERARLTRAQADMEELAVLERRKELVSMATVEEIAGQVFGAIREWARSLPTLAPKCNPNDPHLARAVLTEARDKGMRLATAALDAKPTPQEEPEATEAGE